MVKQIVYPIELKCWRSTLHLIGTLPHPHLEFLREYG